MKQVKKQKKQPTVDVFSLLTGEKSVVEEAKLPELSIWDFIKDLTAKKKYILNDENEKKLKSFSLNRYLSADITTVLHAQEMNVRPHLDVDIVYDYYFYALTKKKIFLQYIKNDKIKDVEMLMKYYQYNRERAKEVLKFHSTDKLKEIEATFFQGGQKNPRS